MEVTPRTQLADVDGPALIGEMDAAVVAMCSATAALLRAVAAYDE